MQPSVYESISFENAPLPMKVSFYALPNAQVEQSISYLVHWHEHLELHRFVKGGARVLVGDQWFDAADGDVFVVNPSEIHVVKPGKQDSEYWCFIVSPQMFGGDTADTYGALWKALSSQQWQIDPRVQDAAVNALLDKVLGEWENAESGYEWAVRGELFCLLAKLYRDHRQTVAVSKGQRQKNRHLKNVLQYIEQHFADALSPQTLADICNLNLSYFCRLFRRSTGVTAATYITAFRLNRACMLLVSTDRSVTDIAQAVGFADPAYFSRQFKKQYGVSPQHYRKNAVAALI
ncbi:MAG: helix-turn-helix transcriptional regulator [Clostridia bacterium]|nr:helix-turn-helix transcriptional regulator [Clostridia bacterium]